MTTRNEENKKRKRRGKSPVKRVLGTIGLIILVTGALLACMAAVYVKIVIIPDSNLVLTDYSLNLTTTVYYKDSAGNDQVLKNLHGTENRIWVDFADIPQDLKNAAVAIEDRRFYKHNGVDWIRTARGLLSMFTGQNIQGGSTITQQLIKNITTENQVTVKRKIKEIFRAVELENNYDKEKILEYYLNCIFLGEGCNGVYTASYEYFGKNVSELSLAECASLIGITNNPSMYNPYRNAEANKFRQGLILDAMRDEKMISAAQCDAAKAEELKFNRGVDEERKQVSYTWFEDAVIDEVIADLREEKNLSDLEAANQVYSGGLQIYTSYNQEVQNAVDAVYSDRANLNYTSPSGQLLQSAITVVDNRDSSIVALAGGVGPKEGSRLNNRASDTKRAPGSSIKPLSVYAPGMELGLITPTHVERDSYYKLLDGNPWPVNAYSEYRGNMTMIEAIEDSCNTIAVKVLDTIVTPQVSFDFMRDRFHIELVTKETIKGKEYTDIIPAALALGGLTKGVSTYEMAAAYSVFPRGGTYYEPSIYSKVLDKNGDVLLQHNTEEEVVLKEKTTFYINQMLERVVQSGTGTRARDDFSNMQIAGKTGTTDSKRDVWFVGYTPYYTAAVWTGYDRQENMSYRSNPSVNLWNQVMKKAHANLEGKQFTTPASAEMETITYCQTTGLRAGSACGKTGKIKLYKEDVPASCTHRVSQPSNNTPQTPSFDINNPATFPSDDPNFKAEDPSTWPTPPSTGDGTGTDAGADGTPPTTDPTQPPAVVAPTE